MMRIVAGFLVLAALAACGADGAPLRPFGNIGIGFGTGGMTTDCSVGGSNGTVTISVDC